jgi:hypothetical protein
MDGNPRLAKCREALHWLAAISMNIIHDFTYERHNVIEHQARAIEREMKVVR